MDDPLLLMMGMPKFAVYLRIPRLKVTDVR